MLFNKRAIKRICDQRQSAETTEIINRKCEDYLQVLIKGLIKVARYCNRRTISIEDVKIIVQLYDGKPVLYSGNPQLLTLHKPFDKYIRERIDEMRLAKGVSQFLQAIIETKIINMLNKALFIMNKDGRETLLPKDFFEYVEMPDINYDCTDLTNALALKYVQNAVLLTRYAERVTIDCAPIIILSYLWDDSEELIDYADEVWDLWEEKKYKNKTLTFIRKLFGEYKYVDQKIGLTSFVYLAAIIEKIISDKKIKNNDFTFV